VLLINGEKSIRQELEVYKKHFPNAEEIKVVEGAGHYVMVDKPDRVIRLISEFMDRI